MLKRVSMNLFQTCNWHWTRLPDTAVPKMPSLPHRSLESSITSRKAHPTSLNTHNSSKIKSWSETRSAQIFFQTITSHVVTLIYPISFPEFISYSFSSKLFLLIHNAWSWDRPSKCNPWRNLGLPAPIYLFIIQLSMLRRKYDWKIA